MKRTRHTLNGKLLGVFYETESGHRIYLGHRQLRHLDRHNWGWSIDTRTLRRCQEEGFEWVGIICRRRGAKHIWLSHVSDWFDPHKSFPTRHKSGMPERGIRLKQFRIDPANDAGKIDKEFSIR
ncbi:MAG TPA: hypothetical protein VFS41_06950 [Edaphobacter sp.]|nr:hypothetical protein [Edaphobacter sp.]